MARADGPFERSATMAAPGKHDGQSGQAAVETALTLPLALFMILGALQLFLMLQARMMAHYAAYKAVRAGAVNYGDCEVMKDAALAALLPTFAKTNDRASYQAALGSRGRSAGYKYLDGASVKDDQGHSGTIFWLDRMMEAPPTPSNFDQWDDNPG